MARVQALQTFSSLEGRIRRGRILETTDEHAAYLVTVGLAERLPGPTSTQAIAPNKPPRLEPSEVNEEIKAVGGGWYEWRGTRYRGRSAAEKARDEEG